MVDRVEYFEKETFAVISTKLEYIRRPRTLSYKWGQTPELSEESQREVIEHTVQYLMKVTGSPMYQAQVFENERNKQ